MRRTHLLRALLAAPLAAAQTWCGKNYEHGSPVVPPGGNFVAPSTSSAPLLAFRCAQGVVPYLPSDAHGGGTLLVDALVTHAAIAGAAPLHAPSTQEYTVTARVGGVQVAAGRVPANATRFSLPLALHGLRPSTSPAPLECTLKAGAQTFAANTTLAYFPENAHGSVTKRDLKTGAILARGTDGKGPFAPVFPVGFYTAFGGYLADNLTVLDDIKAQGFSVVHPIPTFDNLTALSLVLDRMEELGLWLMYDMRWSYTNLSAVEEEVLRIKNRTNLLLWYTADEPDGWGDAQNATTLAYNKIYALDGGYHPVSLVLNCADYFYPAYAAGADILLQDAYTIGNNASWSNQFDTPCTPEYGDCGCDDCVGNLTDVSARMDSFAARDVDLGWDMQKSVWTVPQGFGNDTYWTRYPTGAEWLAQALLALNHGAKGVISWAAPSTPAITAAASQLALAAPAFTPYILYETAAFSHVFGAGVDAGVWADGERGTLVVVANTAYAQARVALKSLGIAKGKKARVLLTSGASVEGPQIVLGAVGTGIFVFE